MKDLNKMKEKEVARKMQKKGYEYILLVKGKDALYAKTMQSASELMRTDLKNYRVNVMKISKYLNESCSPESEDMSEWIKKTLREKVIEEDRDLVESKVSEWWGLLPFKVRKKLVKYLGLAKATAREDWGKMDDAIQSEIEAYFIKHKGKVEWCEKISDNSLDDLIAMFGHKCMEEQIDKA